MTGAESHPRLVSVVNRFPSESETFIERKARALIADGFDVTVAAHHIGRSSEMTGAEAVPMVQLPLVRSPKTWAGSIAPLIGDRTARQRVAHLLRASRRGHWLAPVAAGGFDIVHFEFSGIACRVVDALPSLRPARLAVSCRGAAEQIAPHRDPARRERLERVIAEVDLIHCVSADMAETVRGFGAADDKILVNRPAVNTARWQGVGQVDPGRRGTADAPLRVLSVARLHWKKALDDAVRAIASARRASLHVRYRICGEGPEREKLLYLRHSLGLDDAVELLGWQSQQEVEQHLSWADAFLLPSLSEGISNSALEAMAAGVPLVSSRCGGMAEVLEAPEAGLLVDVGDIEGFAMTLASLVDPSRRHALSVGAAAAVQQDFDLSRQAAVFATAYRALIDAGADTPGGGR